MIVPYFEEATGSAVFVSSFEALLKIFVRFNVKIKRNYIEIYTFLCYTAVSISKEALIKSSLFQSVRQDANPFSETCGFAREIRRFAKG